MDKLNACIFGLKMTCNTIWGKVSPDIKEN